MARTHGASAFITLADGVVLGKDGEPIPTTPTRGIPALHPHGAPAPTPAAATPEYLDAPRPPEAETEVVFRCDKTTWGRNMDGWQAMHLLNAMMKAMFGRELAVTLTEPEARQLPSDTRWNFKRETRPKVNEWELEDKALEDAMGVSAEKAANMSDADFEAIIERLFESGVLVRSASAPSSLSHHGGVDDATPGLEFGEIVLLAMADGKPWTTAELKEEAMTAGCDDVSGSTDLRAISARMLGLKRIGKVDSPERGVWVIARVSE